MRIGVMYSKRSVYQGAVELGSDSLKERFHDDLALDGMTLDGTTASVTIETDIEDLVTDAVEAGDVEEEELISDDEIYDVEVTGLE